MIHWACVHQEADDSDTLQWKRYSPWTAPPRTTNCMHDMKQLGNCFKIYTWPWCSIDLDSLPVLSSSGMTLYFALWPRCIFTPTVTSILPFMPNLGDQILSSISSEFITSMLHVELLLLSSLGLQKNTETIRMQLTVRLLVTVIMENVRETLWTHPHSSLFCRITNQNE